jgi:hypothetical protein
LKHLRSFPLPISDLALPARTSTPIMREKKSTNVMEKRRNEKKKVMEKRRNEKRESADLRREKNELIMQQPVRS